LKKILKKNYGNPDGTLAAKYSFLCGAVAGVFSGIIVVMLFHYVRHLWIMQDLEFLSIRDMHKVRSEQQSIFIKPMA